MVQFRKPEPEEFSDRESSAEELNIASNTSIGESNIAKSSVAAGMNNTNNFNNITKNKTHNILFGTDHKHVFEFLIADMASKKIFYDAADPNLLALIKNYN